jgi:class 3 adenylate cyclase
VRIGVHACVATRSGQDYRGRGVHVAARIGARASAGEILVSRASLSDADVSLVAGDAQPVELKGVAEPVEIVAVRWS